MVESSKSGHRLQSNCLQCLLNCKDVPEKQADHSTTNLICLQFDQREVVFSETDPFPFFLCHFCPSLLQKMQSFAIRILSEDDLLDDLPGPSDDSPASSWTSLCF